MVLALFWHFLALSVGTGSVEERDHRTRRNKKKTRTKQDCGTLRNKKKTTLATRARHTEQDMRCARHQNKKHRAIDHSREQDVGTRQNMKKQDSGTRKTRNKTRYRNKEPWNKNTNTPPQQDAHAREQGNNEDAPPSQYHSECNCVIVFAISSMCL